MGLEILSAQFQMSRKGEQKDSIFIKQRHPSTLRLKNQNQISHQVLNFNYKIRPRLDQLADPKESSMPFAASKKVHVMRSTCKHGITSAPDLYNKMEI